MKLSASIYSQKEIPLDQIVRKLEEHDIDFYHVDCMDDPAVFEDIRIIRELSARPIDLHIISSRPEHFFDLVRKSRPEYLTFQYESLDGNFQIPPDITSSLGLAITSATGIEVFEAFSDRFDFILIMATTPGKSGGVFDKRNFRKIRDFIRCYPGKSIHVDGGVNAEISFILRNMGVSAAVTGSYLFNASYLGAALHNLKTGDIPSGYSVSDFMLSNGEVPILKPGKRSLIDLLKALDDYKLGFVAFEDENGKMEGIVTNADLRKALIRSADHLNDLKVEEMINRNPIFFREEQTVNEMLDIIKSQSFPISYAPVVDKDHKIAGALTFFNLIKGE